MTDHEIKKPVVFISHATSDAQFANAVKQEIEKVFADGIDVFCTSSPGAIPIGQDWLIDIERRLDSAQAVVAIVTPVSIKRPWLWFEIGATWSRGRSGKCTIYPLCVPGMDTLDIPSPLDRLQALLLGRAGDLKRFFKALISQFGFGKLSSLRPSNILEHIPEYEDVKVADTDLDSDSVTLRYAWKFISNYRSLHFSNDDCEDPRFDIFARFVLAVLSQNHPDEGFTHEYVYMRVFKALQQISEKGITRYDGKDFLNEMEVLKLVEVVNFELGVWHITLLGHELLNKWPTDWIYYSDEEVAEILRVSETLEFPTLEEADEIILNEFEW